MVTPKWVIVKAQPIYVGDVIDYLMESITISLLSSIIVEIGGKDIVSYKDIMEDYASARGLKRYMIPILFLTPYLSSLWLGLITPVYARVGRKLIASITESSIILDVKLSSIFSISPLGLKASIRQSLISEDSTIQHLRWSDALSTSINELDSKNVRYGNRILDVYRIQIPESVGFPFRAVERIGGDTGWYFFNSLWKLRGWIDLFVGGVGMRRGRRDPENILVGDVIDWWRVEAYCPGKQLRLKAEMKLPGRAWLDFELIEDRNCRFLQQTVVYDPLGLFGILYWYSLLPIHWILFKGMLRQIVKESE